MFDDVLRTASRCAAEFDDSISDQFGASISAAVIAPILREIQLLRAFNQDYLKADARIQVGLADVGLICSNGPEILTGD